MSDVPRVKAPGVWQLSMFLPIVSKSNRGLPLNTGDTESLRAKLLEQLEKSGLREDGANK